MLERARAVIRALAVAGTLAAALAVSAGGGFASTSALAGGRDPKAVGTATRASPQRAPDFAAETIEGGLFRLSGQRGRVVVLDFLLPGCGECVVEAPQLERAAARFGSRGVRVVIVDLSGAGPDRLREYYRGQLGLRRVTVVRDRPFRFEIARSYRVTGPGLTFVIGRDGRISWRGFWTGAPTRLFTAVTSALS